MSSTQPRYKEPYNFSAEKFAHEHTMKSHISFPLLVFVTFLSFALAGCANKQHSLPPEPVPAWITSPKVENGWVATGCVPSTGDLTGDMNSADLAAKYQIAGFLRTHIQSASGRQLFVVDRTGRRIRSSDSFEDLTQLMIDEELVGTRRIRGEYVSVEGRRLFCSKILFDGELEVKRAADQLPESKPEIEVSPLGASCSNPYNWTAASAKLGKFGYFKGIVTEVSYRNDVRGRPTWISLGNRFPDTNRLSLVIWGNNRSNFSNLDMLADQEICISGTVEEFRNVPQIELKDANQILR